MSKRIHITVPDEVADNVDEFVEGDALFSSRSQVFAFAAADWLPNMEKSVSFGDFNDDR